jgi:hypothetical protein
VEKAGGARRRMRGIQLTCCTSTKGPFCTYPTFKTAFVEGCSEEYVSAACDVVRVALTVVKLVVKSVVQWKSRENVSAACDVVRAALPKCCSIQYHAACDVVGLDSGRGIIQY